MVYILGAEDKPSPEDVLHYGVKGMRWGVRRTPEQLGRARAARKSGGKVGYMDADEQAAAQLVGMAAFAGLMAARHSVESGATRSARAKTKRLIKGEKTPNWKKNEALAKSPMSKAKIMSDVVDPVNDYGKIGTKMNCRRCTVAYEMRRRGHDVKATRTTNAAGQHGKGLEKTTGVDVGGRFSFGKETAYQSKARTWAEMKAEPKDAAAKATFKTLAKQPNGSRGEVGITWAMGGGHSVAYEIIGGKPVIFDAQRKTSASSASEFMKQFGDIGIGSTHFTRLDNAPMDGPWLERWLKNND